MSRKKMLQGLVALGILAAINAPAYAMEEEIVSYGGYDLFKVQYFDDTDGRFSFTACNVTESLNTVVSQTIGYFNSVYILAQLWGAKSNNRWGLNVTTLAQKTDIPTVLPNPNSINITVGDTLYSYNGSETVNVVIDDGTEVLY